MATIEMTVENPRQAVKPPSQSLSSQFQNAVTLSLHLMAKVFQALLVALGFLLPLLLVAAPLYLIVRRWRRRSQETPA